ncbi:MAG: class I SAM-dependent methyltransferase [Rhodothermales bacterium]
MSDIDLQALEQRTREVYERHATAFDQQRAKYLFEQAWLDRFLEGLPAGGRILDMGCGAGEPIARYLIEQGFRVTGFDVAQAMLDIARVRFPDHTWLQGDMRELDLDQSFDGIIGWNSFFHLSPSEQPDTLRRIAAHLAPGGRLMLTVGPEHGEVTGHVNGKQVYHGSLAPDAYTHLLDKLGLTLIDFVLEDETCDFHTVLLAQKPPDSAR